MCFYSLPFLCVQNCTEQSLLPVLEKKRCQGIVSRLWKSRLGWPLTWVHFTLMLYQLICHSVDTGYLRTRGRTNCCHYTLVRSQSSRSSSSRSSSSFPAGRQVPWPEAQKILFGSPCALQQSALSANNICTLSVGSQRVSTSSNVSRRVQRPSPCFTTAVPSNRSLGCCWSPGCLDNTLGNDLLRETTLESTFLFSETTQAMGMCHQWSLLSATRDSFATLFAIVQLFHLYQTVFADQTQAHLPTNGQPVLQNTSTAAAAAGHLRGLIRNSKFHTNLKFAVQISAKPWVNTDFSNERLFSVM